MSPDLQAKVLRARSERDVPVHQLELEALRKTVREYRELLAAIAAQQSGGVVVTDVARELVASAGAEAFEIQRGDRETVLVYSGPSLLLRRTYSRVGVTVG